VPTAHGAALERGLAVGGYSQPDTLRAQRAKGSQASTSLWRYPVIKGYHSPCEQRPAHRCDPDNKSMRAMAPKRCGHGRTKAMNINGISFFAFKHAGKC
jgi:hypothetical protein